MFKKLQEEIAQINSNPNNEENKEKAKILKHKLVIIGTIITIIGIVGVITCFVVFGLSSFNNVRKFHHGFSPITLISFALVIPFSLVLILGRYILALGRCIVIQENTDMNDVVR